MNHVPLGLLARLTSAQLEAIDDLEHQCDLIATRPQANEVRWVLERAGAPADICAAIGAAA